jgi:phage terminase Nu1 subunit (DNA packaging protein)
LPEQRRKVVAEELSAGLAVERAAAETRLAEARADIVAQVAAARQGLLSETEAIAATITTSILGRTA